MTTRDILMIIVLCSKMKMKTNTETELHNIWKRDFWPQAISEANEKIIELIKIMAYSQVQVKNIISVKR